MERFRIHRTEKNLRPRFQSPRFEFCRTPPARTDRPLSARIIALMTRHKHTHTGLVTPSPLDRWIDAMLRVFAMLVQNVCSTLQMIRRQPRVNATRDLPAGLPGEKIDTHQEPHAAQPSSPIALMLRRPKAVSKHEGVLTTRATLTPSFSALCRESRLAHHRDTQLNVPLIPAKAGTQGKTCGLFRLEASIPCKTHHRSWIPAFAGMSGDGFVRRPALT